MSTCVAFAGLVNPAGPAGFSSTGLFGKESYMRKDISRRGMFQHVAFFSVKKVDNSTNLEVFNLFQSFRMFIHDHSYIILILLRRCQMV